MNTETAHTNMVKQQIRTWGVTDDHVLSILQQVPREVFVPKAYRALAYADISIPLAHKQWMLPPPIIGKLLQALNITKADSVLEVGTGSGYLSALLGLLAKQVISVDSRPEFTTAASTKLASLGIDNVVFEEGNASGGWAKHAPYDVIVITGSLPTLPEAFKAQLRAKGRLVAFIGRAPAMQAILIQQDAAGQWHTEVLFETVVPRLENIVEPNRFIF